MDFCPICGWVQHAGRCELRERKEPMMAKNVELTIEAYAALLADRAHRQGYTDISDVCDMVRESGEPDEWRRNTLDVAAEWLGVGS